MGFGKKEEPKEDTYADKYDVDRDRDFIKLFEKELNTYGGSRKYCEAKKLIIMKKRKLKVSFGTGEIEIDDFAVNRNKLEEYNDFLDKIKCLDKLKLRREYMQNL